MHGDSSAKGFRYIQDVADIAKDVSSKLAEAVASLDDEKVAQALEDVQQVEAQRWKAAVLELVCDVLTLLAEVSSNGPALRAPG